MAAPQIISVVSGKGGVGKTMLSVALANELGRAKRTLLVDLDFFNRGLTGLFASIVASRDVKPVAPPRFFQSETEAAAEPRFDWCTAEVKQNLFILSYGDLDKAQYDNLETLTVEDLASELARYIQAVAEQLDCEFVVLDCHGGPDNTSFAACRIAAYSIMVSEPDRITLHGTLNFLRTLFRESPGQQANIYLIFNKVVPAFTPNFLFRFYDEFLRREFGGHDLLAIVPLEIYLTKEFEKSPLLTTVYPMSQLASKTQLIIFDLLKTRGKDNVPAIFRMGKLSRFWRKQYLGRTPKILDLDFILKATALSVIIIISGSLAANRLFGLKDFAALEMIGIPQALLSIALSYGVIWFFAVLWWNWSSDLDTKIIYFIRRKKRIVALLMAAVLGVIWFFFGAVFGLMMTKIFNLHDPTFAHTELLGIGLIVLSIAYFVPYTVRVSRGFKARLYMESVTRTVLATIYAGTAIVTFFSATQ